MIDDLRTLLAEKREAALALHRGGATGMQVCAFLSDACDEVICRAFDTAAYSLPVADRLAIPRSIAVAAVGGYGRRDLAPFSDIDLLFLLKPGAPKAARDFVSLLVRNLWDVGLKLSQSVREPGDCIAFAKKDLPACTALFEARLLTGSTPLFAELTDGVRRLRRSLNVRRLIEDVLAERGREHEDYYSETVCLLEPNVKKSPGGLRDFHVLRWIAAACYGTSDPDALRLSGHLSSADTSVLAESCEVVLRIRNELHFYAGAPQDVLTREEQVRLADWLRFESQGGLLGVERFMQHYYRLTTGLHDVMVRFLERARRPSLARRAVNRVLAQRVGRHLFLRRDHVAIDGAADAEVLGSAAFLLGVFETARGFGVPIGQHSLEQIKVAAPSCEVTPEARASLLASLANPAGLSWLLRGLHRVGLLARLVPPLARVQCLIQFNRMHKYTIDEHSLRAVEAAARRLDDPGSLGQAYRTIRRKDLLHLALLLHDLGKGFEEDHCDVGRKLAEIVAAQFALDDHDTGLLLFLVHKHLMMAHTAFRRDVSDVKTIVQFARSVGTPETLRMLYLITAADTEAVAPGEFSAWKESLLTDLYGRAMEELTGQAPVADEAERTRAICARLVDELKGEFPPEWLPGQLAAMPLAYLASTETARIATHLKIVQKLPPGGVEVESHYLPDMKLTRYTVFTFDDVAPGLFSKIAGVLAANGFQIADAQIVTRSDGIVLDTFHGSDPDFAGPPPAWRGEEMARQIRDVLLGRESVETLLSRRGKPFRNGASASAEPPQVAVDNESSDRFTIIEVFAEDRLGLLYDITRTLFESGLSIHAAKVATHYDQVVDVFYATRGGAKLTNPAQLHIIRQALLRAL